MRWPLLVLRLPRSTVGKGRLTHRRKKELERKKKNRLFHFVGKMREGVIVRRHVAHHTCEQVVLQSTVSTCPLEAFLRVLSR